VGGTGREARLIEDSSRERVESVGILCSISVTMTRTNHQAGEATPVSDLNDQNENHEELMKLVDTETPNPDRFARTADGKIDFDAYRGLFATYRTAELDFEVTILDSRQRYGHLDLLITPESGAGERWTEFKNLTIHNDPAGIVAAPVAVVVPSPEIEAEPEEITVLTVVEPDPGPHGTRWTKLARLLQ